MVSPLPDPHYPRTEPVRIEAAKFTLCKPGDILNSGRVHIVRGKHQFPYKV